MTNTAAFICELYCPVNRETERQRVLLSVSFVHIVQSCGFSLCTNTRLTFNPSLKKTTVLKHFNTINLLCLFVYLSFCLKIFSCIISYHKYFIIYTVRIRWKFPRFPFYHMYSTIPVHIWYQGCQLCPIYRCKICARSCLERTFIDRQTYLLVLTEKWSFSNPIRSMQVLYITCQLVSISLFLKLYCWWIFFFSLVAFVSSSISLYKFIFIMSKNSKRIYHINTWLDGLSPPINCMQYH